MTNTVAYSFGFTAGLGYHSPRFTTVLLMIPEEVIEGKKGIFERLNDGGWGIPPEYIVGAFKDMQVFQNPNYNKGYFNQDAKCIDDPEEICISYDDRKEQIEICSKAFYIGKRLGNNDASIKENGRLKK